MEYRILFTGIGRRIELVQAFRQAALTLNVNLKIYGADMTDTAPALAFCDHVRRVCAMRDNDYIPQLLKICRKEKIDLLIPTIDTDLLALSRNADSFRENGTQVLISSPEMIAVCRDKNYTADFFRSCGVKAPKTVNCWEQYNDAYPCFIKPKDGSSSINAYQVKDSAELPVYAEKIGDYIIQPFIEGTEYTVDVFCDFEGSPIHITPRIRASVRAGEVLKTEITADEKIIDETKRIIEKFKPCGPMTVQLIRQTQTGDDYFIEINPRFGGGAPLSMKAGARSAETVLRLMQGEKIDFCNTACAGEVYSRFDQSVCTTRMTEKTVKGIIFDLDDTLYSEKDYVRSGFTAVAEYLGKSTMADKLWGYFLDQKPAIDELLQHHGKLYEKQKCLNIYRNHRPDIDFYPGVKDMLIWLKNKGIHIGVITDGRVEGQRNKIQALGLDSLVDDIIITDELGGTQFRKPNDISFRIMQCRWRIPFETMIYVGDNREKDFMAPMQLGMQALWFRNPDGLYQNGVDEEIGMRSCSRILDVLNLF